MFLIDHTGYDFMSGVRVLMLSGRHKDNADKKRSIMRVSYDEEDYVKQRDSLISQAQPKERLYSSASIRDMSKAIRLFKERQLAADYDLAPEHFYMGLEARWISCLMAVTSEARPKAWLWDCDTDEERATVQSYLSSKDICPYEYQTKNGTHFITKPFNREDISADVKACLKTNALMLVGYS